MLKYLAVSINTAVILVPSIVAQGEVVGTNIDPVFIHGDGHASKMDLLF